MARATGSRDARTYEAGSAVAIVAMFLIIALFGLLSLTLPLHWIINLLLANVLTILIIVTIRRIRT